MENEDATFKICPFCKEKIRKEAIKCRFCGEWLEHSEPASSVPLAENPPNLANLIEPPALPRIESQSVAAAPTNEAPTNEPIPVKTLYRIGAALLAVSAVILFICFAQVPWQRLEADSWEKIFTGLFKVIIGVAAITWYVKRKGYRFLTFSIACTAFTAIFVYYFFDGRHNSQQRRVATNNQVVEYVNNLQHFIQQGAVGKVPEFVPTGDADIDSLFRTSGDLHKKYFEGLRQVNARLEGQTELSQDSLLTNKSNLQLEIQKRIDGQKIIGEFATNATAMIEQFNRDCASLQIDERYKKGVSESVNRNFPMYKAFFDSWIKYQKAEQLFLEFLADNFDDYKMKDGNITFHTRLNIKRYDAVAKDVQDAAALLESFQKRGLTLMEEGKKKIQSGLGVK